MNGGCGRTGLGREGPGPAACSVLKGLVVKLAFFSLQK